MRHTSRSAQECFRRCRRKYFYQYAYPNNSDGGYQSPRVFEAPTLGSALHLAMPHLLQSDGKKAAVKLAVQSALQFWAEATQHGFLQEPTDRWLQIREEGAALIEALLLGWNRTRRARFLQEFKPLYIEEEFDLILSPNLCFDSRPDLIVEDHMGQLWIVDWKSVGKAWDWAQKFRYETQTYTQPFIASKRLGREIKGTLYEGLWKGNTSGSILIRGIRSTAAPNLYSGQLSDSRKTQMERFDVFSHQFDGQQPSQSPIDYWVNWLPEEVVRDQFLTPQAIPYDAQLAQHFFDTTLMLEEQVEATISEYESGQLPIEHVLDFFYPSHSDWNCQGCVYSDLCWANADIKRLIKDRTLVPRVDHHKRADA